MFLYLSSIKKIKETQLILIIVLPNVRAEKDIEKIQNEHSPIIPPVASCGAVTKIVSEEILFM